MRFCCCKIDFQNYSGKSIGSNGDLVVINTKLVPSNDAVDCGLPHYSPAEKKLTMALPLLEIETFQRKLSTSSYSHGETRQNPDILEYTESGKAIAFKGMLFSLLQMWRLHWVFLMVCISVDICTVVFGQPEVQFLCYNYTWIWENV